MRPMVVLMAAAVAAGGCKKAGSAGNGNGPAAAGRAAEAVTYTPAGGPVSGFRVNLVGTPNTKNPLHLSGETADGEVSVAADVFTPPAGTPADTPEQLYAALRREYAGPSWVGFAPADFRGTPGIEATATQTVTAGNFSRTQGHVFLFAVKNGKGYAVQVSGKRGPPPADVVRAIRESFEVL